MAVAEMVQSSKRWVWPEVEGDRVLLGFDGSGGCDWVLSVMGRRERLTL